MAHFEKARNWIGFSRFWRLPGRASPEKPKQPGAFQEQAGAQEVPHPTNAPKSWYLYNEMAHFEKARNWIGFSRFWRLPGRASPEKPKQPGAFQEQAGAQEVPHPTNAPKSWYLYNEMAHFEKARNLIGFSRFWRFPGRASPEQPSAPTGDEWAGTPIKKRFRSIFFNRRPCGGRGG